MYDNKELTEISLSQFRFFVKHLVENNLLDEMEQALTAKGINNLRVSLAPILEIQNVLKDKHNASDSSTPRDAQMIIQCTHNKAY